LNYRDRRLISYPKENSETKKTSFSRRKNIGRYESRICGDGLTVISVFIASAVHVTNWPSSSSRGASFLSEAKDNDH